MQKKAVSFKLREFRLISLVTCLSEVLSARVAYLNCLSRGESVEGKWCFLLVGQCLRK